MSTTENTYQEALARAQAGGGAPWMPQKEKKHPKEIVGECVDVQIISEISPFSGQLQHTPVVELRCPPEYAPDKFGGEGDTWSIRGYATTLYNQIVRADVQAGGVYAFVYKGEVTPRDGGNKYHSFSVAGVDTQKSRVDYARLGAPPAEVAVPSAQGAAVEQQESNGPPQPDQDIPF